MTPDTITRIRGRGYQLGGAVQQLCNCCLLSLHLLTTVHVYLLHYKAVLHRQLADARSFYSLIIIH